MSDHYSQPDYGQIIPKAEVDVRATTRISKDDKEAARAVLKKAAQQGRIDPDAFAARLGEIYKAKEQSHIDAVTSDLPQPPKHLRTHLAFAGALVTSVLVAIPLPISVWAATGHTIWYGTGANLWPSTLRPGWAVGVVWVSVVLGILGAVGTAILWTQYYDHHKHD